MDKNTFWMDHGPAAPARTELRRQPKRIGGTVFVWRDASGEIEFDENIEQHPVDGFGLPIFGDFGERS